MKLSQKLRSGDFWRPEGLEPEEPHLEPEINLNTHKLYKDVLLENVLVFW